MGAIMRVLIADDHDLVRDSIKSFIERVAPDITVLDCGSLDEALSLIERQAAFDVIVLDLRMPGMNGFDGLKKVQELRPQTPVVVMSGSTDSRTAHEVLDHGARGFFPKTMTGKVLVSALRLVMAGEIFIPSAYVAGTATADRLAMESSSAGGPAFTRREQEVLGHLLRGRSNKEIALSLGLEEVTVKLHVRGVCRKLGARNRTEAVAIAHQRGLAA